MATEDDVAVTDTSASVYSLVPIAASLFGMSEFLEDWEWRIAAQVGLVAVPWALRTTAGRQPGRLGGILGGAILLLACSRSHSGAWLLLGATTILAAGTRFGRERSHALLSFVMIGVATMGAGCAYLQAPVVWEWPRLQALLRAFFEAIGSLWSSAPSLLPTGEIVLRGEPIHISAFSVLAALPMIASVVGYSSTSSRRTVVVGGGALAFAAAFKAVIVIGLAGIQRPEWLVHPLVQGSYFVAVGLVTMFLVNPGGSNRRDVNSPSAVGVAVFSGLALWCAFAPRAIAPNRRLEIVIDDAHGLWERTDLPFDCHNYGRETVYTYTLLRDWLSRRHTVDVQSGRPIRPHGEVLLIKTPALAYSSDETVAIEKFVAAGGGLLVIGDHTNLFGTTRHINALLAPFGIRLREDAAIPFQGVTRSFAADWYNSNPLIPQGAAFDFATSATVAATSWRARPIIVDFGVVAEKAQYSNERNFGDLRPSLDDRAPPLVVAATVPWGKGRVVLFADSTPWSNFSFFAPGSKEVLSHALSLAAAPTVGVWPEAWLAIALLSTSVVFIKRGTFLTYCVAAFAIYGVASALFPISATRSYRATVPAEGGTEEVLVVDAVHSGYRWDSDIRTETPRDRDTYSTFFAWASRVGVFPEFRTRDAYDDPTLPVLVLNPAGQIDAATSARVEQYVRKGGRLLVLDDPLERAATTAPQLLNVFGIRYEPQTVGMATHEDGGPPLPDLVWALPLSLLAEGIRQPGPIVAERTGLGFTLLGVTPVLVDDHGLVLYGRKAVGLGSVNAFIRSSVFSQLVMGDVWGGIEPGRFKEQIYRLEYRLLSEIYPGLGGRSDCLSAGGDR